MFYCVCCGCRMRKDNKALEFLGLVCSTCFRMSNKQYYSLVDILSNKKIEFILNEIKKNNKITN